MVLCKFYAQGNCKFGNSCKFEHSQGQYQQNYNQNRYQQNYNNKNYQSQGHSNNQYHSQQAAPPTQNSFSNLVRKKTEPKTVSDPDCIANAEEFLDFISPQFQEWLDSSMWKLSNFKYNKTAKNLPILQDISSEEVRFALYEAKKQNRFSAELQQFQAKYNQTIETIKQLAHPNKQTREYLIQYFNESELAKKQQQNQNTNANPFVQIIQKKQQELMQNQGFPSLPNNMPLFQQNTDLPIQHGFLQQQSVDRIQTSNSFLFTNISAPNNQNNQTQKENPFKLLTTGKSQQAQTSFFANQLTNVVIPNEPANNLISPFLTHDQQHSRPDLNPNPQIYSNTSDLNELDIKEFKSDKFTLGLIPHMPPTKQLCA